MANASPLADPTVPLNHQREAINKETRSALPKLQSILRDGEQRRAILNNNLYQVGQSVAGYKITAIKKDAVLLRYKGQSYKLTLYTKKEHFIK